MSTGHSVPIADAEVVFIWPDALLRLTSRQKRAAQLSSDLCVIDLDADSPRYFVRCVLPVAVEGRCRELHWGIWVEVSPDDFGRVVKLWRDPRQHETPPFRAELANQIPHYSPSEGLEMEVQLVSPTKRPVARFLEAQEHEFVRQCRNGVSEGVVAQWLCMAGLSPVGPDAR